MPNVEELLEDHVRLEVECVDRMYLNGYVAGLGRGGGLYHFLSQHLGKPVPSPAVLGQISRRFVEQLQRYAEQQEISIVRFERGQCKDDVAQQMRRERAVRDEVVFIGVAQEKALTFSGRKQQGQFDFQRDTSVYVNHYYFYVDDEEFGPAFVKVCSYAPWGLKSFASTDMNGPSGSWRSEESATKPSTMGFFAAKTRRNSKRSATSWGPRTSSSSSAAGCKRCRCRCRPKTANPATTTGSRSGSWR